MKTLKKINPGDALAKLGTVPVYMLMPVTAQTTIGQLMQADRLVCEVDDETAPKPKAKPAKNVIDHGKIMALHKAGWSPEKIAGEMRISPQTARNHIKQDEPKAETK